MQGSLKQIQLPEVLQFVSMGKSNGLLTVRAPSGHTTILTIRSGRIVNSSALERSRKLGDVLVQRGFLRRSALNQVLAYQKHSDPEAKLGQLLIERDLVTEKQIDDVLRLQLEEEIWGLFGLEAGDFKFEPHQEAKLPPEVLSLEIEPLILEGTRRQDEWRKIMRILPHERLILGVRRQPPDGEPFPKLRENEWKVLSSINGILPIRGVINRCALGKFEVFQILAFLLRKGMIYLKGEAPPLPTEHGTGHNQSSSSIPTRGMAGLLAKLTGGSARPRTEDRSGERTQFPSPVSLLGAIANRVAETLVATLSKDGTATVDPNIIDGLWLESLSSFPRADLITLTNSRIDIRYCEKFFRGFDYGDEIQDAYEDSIEALLMMIELCHSILTQKHGEKTASRIVREAVEEFAPRSVLTVQPEFKVEERLQSILAAAG